LKETKKHINWGDLKDAEKLNRLLPGRKRLMDTVRMIDYRSEAAMTGLSISKTVKMSDARCLLQDMVVSDVDILPDTDNNLLRVRIHNA